MKNALSAAMVLIGTFIGAGFASGQEVIQYFGIFGNYGVAGILISCLLLSAFTYCTVDNVNFLGEREYINKICKFKWVNLLINGYMALIYCTMITAFGETINQIFFIPKIYGVIFINMATIIVLYFGSTAVMQFNCVVTPLIILGILFTLFTNNTVSVFNNFATSAVIYTSYNVITLPFVIVGMKNIVNTKRKSVICSVVFGAVICVLALCMFALLKGVDGESVQIPLLSVTSGNYVYVMVIILALSMVTTAVANGYGLINNLPLSKNIVIFFLFVFGNFFSTFKFSFIVKYLYMGFGYMGLYVIINNFCIFIKNREKPRKIEIINNK